MKSLFLTQDFPPALGGIARLYEAYVRRFPAGSVEVATVADAADPDGSLAAAGLPDTVVNRMPFSYRKAKRLSSVVAWTRWADRRLTWGDIDLLQVGDLRPAGYVAAWLGSRRQVPYVIYVHGIDVWKEEQRVPDSLRRRLTARRILGGAGAIIANSRATAARARRVYDLLGLEEGGRVRVVNPGTDPDRFRPDPAGGAAWRRELDLGKRRVVLTVARLVQNKGIDTALRAFASVAADEPDLVHVIAGTGPERERLESLAGDLGVRDRVRFLGAVDDARLPALYAAADVFLLPTREWCGEEGFGIVFCEAAACGVPVVAGASNGVTDAVRDGETGLLVPALETDRVTAALDRLVKDGELRRRLGDGGRRAVETHYNWDRAAAEAWAILCEVAKR